MLEMDPSNTELLDTIGLFFDDIPNKYEIKNTSRGESDFRETVILEWISGEKYVIKLSDNDFTFADKIKSWKRCAEEYRKLGYYCPDILYSKNGDFPTVVYKGHCCVAYAEEFSKYGIVDERADENSDQYTKPNKEYMDEAFVMTARIAAERLDFTDYPSGYCLFESFCPSDKTDEVLENALEWKKYADTLPAEFQLQVRRIWQRWNENRAKLKQLYFDLPTSVFQADLNPTNLLIDDNGKFVGIFDFNLCGKDVLLNYMIREICWFSDSDEEINYILDTLKNISKVYCFSDIEKRAAPLLYRCLKPLWFSEVEKLKKAGNDINAVKSCLDKTENLQTRSIDFEYYMNNT